MRPSLATSAAALALVVACQPAPGPTEDPGNATFRYRASVEQVMVWKAKPGAALALERAGAGAPTATATADEQGSFIFRKVPAGAGYVVRAGAEYTRALTVTTADASLPPPAFYASQKLAAGFQYITTRDGTELSVYVTLPGPAKDGPYPTVVNYSGYNPSQPGAPLGDYKALCGDIPVLCDAPHADASIFAAADGYATVNVNIRGTGCSGGAYDYFEELQLLDGYDVVEVAAAQSWVLGNKVGMIGLSYPGIAQLFVARTHPPHLAAISPLSVIANTASTLVPGGIPNDGFALEWVTNVLDKAKPYGQGWEQKRVDGGDAVCAENQLLHSQRVDNVAEARSQQFYDPALVDPLNPEKFVGEIDVPVFIAGAWQDEQTGPFFAELMSRFTKAPALRMSAHNGIHRDQYAPAIFTEWLAFLDLFVAERVPTVPPVVRALGPELFKQIFGVGLQMPPDRFAAFKTHDAALAAWSAEPALHVLFESGAGPDGKALGAPTPAFEKTFAAWPPPATARRFFFQPDGSLGDAPPTALSAASDFAVDPEAGKRGILAPDGDVNDLLPAYAWAEPAPDRAVVFDSGALSTNVVMAGTASADLWIRADATEADLQVNLSELRPDGQELYVQSGWLRASQRKLGADSTDLDPRPTHLAGDAEPLVPGEWVLARVGLAPFAHAFRAGSRVRVWVDTPGGSRAEWRFSLAPVPDGSRIAIGHDAAHPSSVALPVLEDTTVPTPLPPCTLRGQPCRAAMPYANAVAK